jgi:DNA-binding transcriptional LysR family regulator
VRAALATLRQALAPQAYDPAVDAANFRLAMVDATAALVMPRLVAVIEGTRARANLRVLPLATRDPRALLERGDTDLALGYFPPLIAAIQAAGPDATLRHQRLYDTDYVCVMRRGHPLDGPALTLDAFCDAHHLLVSFSGRAHGFVDEALAALGRQRRIVLTVNQFFVAARVVRGSDLLTVMPASFVASTGLDEALAAAPLPLALPRVQVEMVWHVRRHDDPAHAWLRRQVADAAAG